MRWSIRLSICSAYRRFVVTDPRDLPPGQHEHSTAPRSYVLFCDVMSAIDIERELTIWMTDDIPTRMLYAGRRWRITDTPTRLRHSSWDQATDGCTLYGWRFQATDGDGATYVFDVYRHETGWHLHHSYS